MSLLDTASLIVTPNAYKEGKLYSVIPSDGSGDMSVGRATTATRVNSAGLVELVPYNLLSYSEQFNNGVWGAVDTTITANTTTAPNGTLTADTMTITSSTSRTFQTTSLGSGTYTASVYVKSLSGTPTIQFRMVVDGADITDAIPTTTDWVRHDFTFTASTSMDFFVLRGQSGTGSVAIWGAQLVEGSVAKDYQKTETRLNIPRLDYSNGTCPSLLVEPQRTNLAWYSENFGGGGWSISSGAITDNTTTAPNGVNSADLYTANGTLNNHDFFQGFTGGSATTSTIYVKKNTAQFVYISLNYQGSGSDWATGIYDLDNLTTATFQSGGVTNQVATITDEGNGWRRITLSVSTGNTALFCMYGVADSMSPTLSARGRVENSSTASFYAWGSQFEIGSYATSYIQTGLGSVTRNADVISKTGISSLIGQTEGTLFWEGQGNTQSTGDDLWIFGASVNDTSTAVLLYYVHSSGYINCFINNGSSYVNLGVPMTITNNNKVAVGYKSGDFVMYVNGVQVDSNTSATAIPSGMNQVAINKWLGATGFQKQSTKAVALWKTRLTNAQLATLTTI